MEVQGQTGINSEILSKGGKMKKKEGRERKENSAIAAKTRETGSGLQEEA